jgi:hypothetical protein
MENTKMKSGLSKLGLAGTVLALAACGGTTDSGPGGVQVTSLISVEEQALRVFADDGAGSTQDFGDVFARGDVLVARQVAEATYRENFNDDTYTPVDGDVRLQLVGNDLEVTFTVAGDASPTVITIPDARTLTENSYRTPDGAPDFFDIFLGGELTFAQMLDGSRDAAELLRIGLYYDADDTGFGLNARVVVGTETTDARIAELITAGGSVDYTGFGSMDIRRQGSGFDTYNAQLSGNMTMTANFDTQSVSGEMANPRFLEGPNSAGPGEDLTGSVLFNNATIRDNAFAGSMSVDQTFETARPDVAGALSDLDYGGAFYGENGTAIGGSISGTGQHEGDDFAIIGNFEVYN